MSKSDSNIGKVRSRADHQMHISAIIFRVTMGLTGFEPVTLRLSSACSNQLSYRPNYRLDFAPLSHSLGLVVEVRGFEPLTYSLQS